MQFREMCDWRLTFSPYGIIVSAMKTTTALSFEETYTFFRQGYIYYIGEWAGGSDGGYGMNVNRRLVLVFFVACVVATVFLAPAVGGIEGGRAGASGPCKHEEQALRLGRKVLAVRAAIRNPKDPDAMKAIMDLGTDSRYYVMVRGWLTMKLQGDMSIIDANQDETRPEIRERVEFLRKAIRAIDLE